EYIILPANKLFYQHSLPFLVYDDIAATDRRLEWAYEQQPARFVARLPTVARHVYGISGANSAQIGRARRRSDRPILKEHFLVSTSPRSAADRYAIGL